MTRPPRKYIPMRTRRAVVKRQNGLCKCGCGLPVFAEPGRGTHFDHEPALGLRNLNRRRTDYVPSQLSVRHLDAYATKACHDRKTFGTGATTAGTDFGKIKKERRRLKPKRKRRLPPRPMRRVRADNTKHLDGGD